MRWRTLISAVLILALLPISSVAAVCALNCRTNGMPSMAMESMSRHGGHNASATHHHETTSDSDPNSIAAVSHQFLASHACCSDPLPTQNSPCVGFQDYRLQDQTVVPKCGDFAIVQQHVTGRFVLKEPFSRDSIPLTSIPPAVSHSGTLRI